MAKGKAAIGYLHRDEALNPWFALSVNELLDTDWRSDRRFKGRCISICSGPMIDRARNDLVETFLRHPESPDWLLMVDSDMAFTPTDVRNLFQAADATERPVVGGLCFAANGGNVWPVLIRFRPDGYFERLLDYPRNQLVQVDGTGAAFLLIHRSIFTRMHEVMRPEEKACPWFATGYTADGRYFTEDVTFCARLRRIGVPVYVDTRVKIKHMKMVPIDEDFYDLVRPKGNAIILNQERAS